MKPKTPRELHLPCERMLRPQGFFKRHYLSYRTLFSCGLWWDIRSHSTQYTQLKFATTTWVTAAAKAWGQGLTVVVLQHGAASSEPPRTSLLRVWVLCPLCCPPWCTMCENHVSMPPQRPNQKPCQHISINSSVDLVFNISAGKTEYFVMPDYISKFKSSLRP